MEWKKATMIGSACMVGAFVLSGCQDSNEQNQAEGSDQGDLEISMIHYFNPELNEPAPMAQLERMDDFLEQHPDLTMDIEVQSHDNYETKITTLAAADELPDLFLIKGSMTQAFADNGQIMPVEQIYESHPGWSDLFVDGTMTPFEANDTHYGVPISGGATHIIYYNEDLFAEAGLSEFPADWDGFMEAIDQLNDAGITPIALGNQGRWVANSSYLSTLANRFTGTEWFQDILAENGNASFTDEAFVNALRTLHEMAENDAFNNDLNSIDNSQQQSMYMNGEAAMFIEGDWAAGGLVNHAPDEILDATGVAIFPAVTNSDMDQNTVSGGGGWAYAVNANVSGEKLDVLTDMLYHLTNEDAGKLVLENGQIPAVTISNTEDVDITAMTMQIMALLEESQYVHIYDTVLSPSIIDVMNANLQNMFIGEVTPEQAAENIQNEYGQ